MSLPEEFENNFTIISGSREFKVDKFQIASRMTRFKKDPILFLSGIYQIKSKSKDSIVEGFIEAAKTGKCPEFTLDNVSSYQQLSLEFEFNSLFHKCNSFILSHKDLTKLISDLLSPSYTSNMISDKEETLNAIEIAFAFNLNQDRINQLKSLPNPVLYRILSIPTRPHNQSEKNIYDIIKTKIDRGDQEAKFLLQAINYNSLNHNDLSSIISYNKKPKNHNKQQSQTSSSQSTTPAPAAPPPATTPTNQAQISTSKSLTEKSDKSPSSQSSSHNKKVLRAPATIRASSTTNIADNFQAVYIPENSDLKQSERRIIEIVNTRRSHEYPLTLNQEISAKLQSYYGSLEEVKPPGEIEYLILKDRFIHDIDHQCLLLALEENENNLYDTIRSEINKFPIEDISNSNFFALSVVKVNSGFYYCAIIIGNAECGEDQIDPNPPVRPSNSNSNLPLPSSKQLNSTPTLSSVDLIESVKSSFYQTDRPSDDIRDLFFNEEYSLQLMNYLEKVEKSNEKVTVNSIIQAVPELKSCQVFFKFGNQMNTFLDSIKSQNRNKNNCIIALAAKKFNNNKFVCFAAYINELFTDEQKELVATIKSLNLKSLKTKNFEYDVYKTLLNFISTPKDLPETGKPIDSLKFNDNNYHYIFLKGPNLQEITFKISNKLRIKISLATKLSAAVKKLENTNTYQLIMVYWKPEQ